MNNFVLTIDGFAHRRCHCQLNRNVFPHNRVKEWQITAMSDTALYEKAAAILAEIPQGCQILILSEDFAAYSRAVEVCRRIMDHLGKDLDFDFRCWNFVELADPNCAHNAAKYAAVAEIIMLSAQSAVLSPTLGDWLDALHASRFRAYGALVLVLNKPASQFETGQLTMRLEKLASRLAMDFVPLLPETDEANWQSGPSENWPMLQARPENLDSPPGENWGLNE